jgi:hypothetical protein
MMFFVEIGLMVAIIVLGSAAAKHFFGAGGRSAQSHATRADQGGYSAEAARLRYQERADARELYEKLVREKLAVVRDAIAMGYSEVELSKLDKRLAELIGEEDLKKLLSDAPEAPVPSADLLDTDLASEVEKMRKPREQN